MNDQAWDEHWLKFMKHKDLEAIPDGAEVPEARLVLVPRILNNGDLQHFIYLVGHEIGHILDEQRFVAEFLANEDDVTIQQVLSIGIFQRYGIGIEGVNISAFRNGLENVERNGIAQEILVTSIGMWLADPQKYEISYPLAHQFFMEIFPEITKVLNKTKSTQMTTVPNHWGAQSGKTEDNDQ